MKKVMKASKKYIITIASFAVILVACIGATIGITMAYFGDVKNATASISLGASISFKESGGIAVAATGVTSAVPSQVVNVDTTLVVVKGAKGETTNGVLQVTPEFTSGVTGLSLTFTNGTKYTVSGDVTGAEMVVQDNKLYLVTTGSSNLKEIVPDADGITIKFTVPVTIPAEIGNTQGGNSFSLKMTAKVLQSTIYTDATTTAPKTVTGFATYFNSFTAAA